MTDQRSTGNPAWIYEQFYVPSMFRPWAEELIRRANAQPGERILDVACGTGVVSRLLAKRFDGDVQLMALDLNPNMLAVARQKAQEEGVAIDFREGNAAEMPFPDLSFDVVFIQQGLQFFPDRAAALAEVRRVLDDDGRVAVLVWGALDHQPFSKVEAQAVRKHLGIPAMDAAFSLGNSDELSSVFVNAGFSDISVDQFVREARFASADAYFDTVVQAASAAVSQLQSLGAEGRTALASAVKAEMAETIQAHLDGGALVYPTEVNILLARKGA